MARSKRAKTSKDAASKSPAARDGGARNYDHPEATAAHRPDVGVQKQFRKKKPPKTYRYDPSLSPSLQWDERPARERGEALIRRIQEAGSLEEASWAGTRRKTP
jgi:adenine-specific DNA-methyltransferase